MRNAVAAAIFLSLPWAGCAGGRAPEEKAVALSVQEGSHGRNAPIPEPLKAGRASEAYVLEWTSKIRAGEPIVRRDLNSDGREDLLAEVVVARGTTGNCFFLVFVATKDGFRFAGDTGNLYRAISFGGTGRAYLIDHSNCGTELGVGLARFSDGVLAPVGRPIILKNIDPGVGDEDTKIVERFRSGTWTEPELLRVFTEGRLGNRVLRLAPKPPAGKDSGEGTVPEK
jgi:hypothetical protein